MVGIKARPRIAGLVRFSVVIFSLPCASGDVIVYGIRVNDVGGAWRAQFAQSQLLAAAGHHGGALRGRKIVFAVAS